METINLFNNVRIKAHYFVLSLIAVTTVVLTLVFS